MTEHLSTFLEAAALVGATCAGFIVAQAATRRANQLAAALVLGASWWALANAHIADAADAEAAMAWMRAGAPGWAFIGGLLPHLGLRYFDAYPRDELVGMRRLARTAARVGYAAGAVVLVGTLVAPDALYRDLHTTAWGWSHVPGPMQLAFFAVSTPCAMLVFPLAYRGFRSSVAVAPLAQRLSIYASMSIPALAIGVTEMGLPILRVDAPRLGAVSYALFGVIFVVAVLRYGLSFLAPLRFSHEILDTLNEGVAMLTPAGRIRHVNRSLVRLSGYTADELVGRSAQSLLTRAATAADAEAEASAELETRSGGAIPVAISTTALRDQRGNDLGLVVVLRDLREIRSLRSQILTQARLAAVGELAAGVAHEINNPLAFVRANLGLLEGYVKTLASDRATAEPDAAGAEIERDAIDAIRESLEGVDRVTSVVQGVRRFTESSRLVREGVKLDQLIEDAIAMARLQARSAAVRFEHPHGDAPEITCAPHDMRQVFLDLLVNAADATDGRGTVHVSTRMDGGHAIVSVEDDGRGMSAEEAARVFDPFYTTKYTTGSAPAPRGDATGERTGLGLTIAWHVVEAHGGTIEVESRKGRGTTFSVRLPAEPVRQPA